ncbi:MAG: hypothetical protein QOC66_1984 [Pseudonocardiales bacterium]|nr:hypothetical protein [Pseudonocardiales bacterium]
MSIVITGFELPSGSDAVVAPGFGYRLYRALDTDARFRYITVGEREPEVPVGGDGVQTLSGRYEVHDVGDVAAPAFGAADGSAPIVFINALVVEPGNEDAAFAVWKQVNEYMVVKPGYRSHRLHRRLQDDAPFGFVNVVEWESLEAWDAAHDEGFRALTDPSRLPFRPVPTVCELIDDNHLQAAGRQVRS